MGGRTSITELAGMSALIPELSWFAAPASLEIVLIFDQWKI